MPFDPNEPRDWHGRWVEDATAATQKAASDKTIQQMAEENARQGEQLKDILKKQEADKAASQKAFEEIGKTTQGQILELSALTPEEMIAMADVVKEEAASNGWNEGITRYVMATNKTEGVVGASYSWNDKNDIGILTINPRVIETKFPYVEKPDTYDEAIKKVEAALDEYRDMPEDNLFQGEKVYLTNLRSRLEALKEFKEEGKPNLLFNAATGRKEYIDRFKQVIYHELGHMRLQEAYNKAKKITDPYNPNYTSSSYEDWKHNNLIREFNSTPISQYAMTNYDEYFAEAYSEYKMTGKASDGFKEFLKKINIK